MLGRFKGKKGTTLIEIILSITVLGVISVPLLMSFTNAMMVAQLTKRQTEINIVTRIVKENVTEAVKNPNTLPAFNSGSDIVVRDATGIVVSDTQEFKVIGKGGVEYKGYKYTVKDETQYKIVNGSTVIDDSDSPNTYQLLIALKKDNKDIQKIKVGVNILPDVP